MHHSGSNSYKRIEEIEGLTYLSGSVETRRRSVPVVWIERNHPATGIFRNDTDILHFVQLRDTDGDHEAAFVHFAEFEEGKLVPRHFLQ